MNALAAIIELIAERLAEAGLMGWTVCREGSKNAKTTKRPYVTVARTGERSQGELAVEREVSADLRFVGATDEQAQAGYAAVLALNGAQGIETGAHGYRFDLVTETLGARDTEIEITETERWPALLASFQFNLTLED